MLTPPPSLTVIVCYEYGALLFRAAFSFLNTNMQTEGHDQCKYYTLRDSKGPAEAT